MALGTGLQQQLTRDLTAFEAAVHVGGLGQWEDLLDRHPEPALDDARQHMIDARLPLGRALVDMTEVQARKSLRTRQDALADVLEGLALGLADADHVAELL